VPRHLREELPVGIHYPRTEACRAGESREAQTWPRGGFTEDRFIGPPFCQLGLASFLSACPDRFEMCGVFRDPAGYNNWQTYRRARFLRCRSMYSCACAATGNRSSRSSGEKYWERK